MNKASLPIKRRLAAIFCADVAAYARLMSVDETGTLYLLNTYRGIMDRQITQHGGRTANTAGDSIVAEFSSAVDAVRCAVDIQERIAAMNDDVPQERRVVFRIGVHVGEVVVRYGDIFGDGVNIAARMEKLSKPGEVCLSEVAHDFVSKVLPLTFDDLGPQVVKNVSTPIRAYAIRPLVRLTSRILPPVHRHNEFNLGQRFIRVLTSALAEITRPEGLTALEPAVFASLHDAPGIGQRRVAERTGCDCVTVRRMLRHLRYRGWICRVPGATKSRAHLYSLTPAGLELYARLHPAIVSVQDHVMAPLSERERENLRDLLRRVISANEPERASP